MQFPARDFTNQYISTSYQDVLQKYNPSDTFYILDGLGNVIFSIPSSSLGQVLVTSDITSSMSVATASYAITYSYSNIVLISSSFASQSVSSSYSVSSSHSETSDNSDFALAAYYSTLSDTASYAVTASYALNGGGGGTSLTTGSTYPITSSWAISASWAPGNNVSNTSSYSITSSYALIANRVVDSGLSIPQYDYSNIIYDGPQSQFGNCTYRLGGISGSIVAVITGIYSGSLFIGVSKSLS